MMPSTDMDIILSEGGKKKKREKRKRKTGVKVLFIVVQEHLFQGNKPRGVH